MKRIPMPPELGEVLLEHVEFREIRFLLERCKAMLAGLEWDGIDGYKEPWPDPWSCCPVCRVEYDGPHAESCPLAALLSDLRKELGK